MLGMRTEATCKMKTKPFTAQWELCYMAGVEGTTTNQNTGQNQKQQASKQASKPCIMKGKWQDRHPGVYPAVLPFFSCQIIPHHSPVL